MQYVKDGEADAVIQEAIMTPGWTHLVENELVRPVPADMAALAKLERELGIGTNVLPKGFWTNSEALPALDFSDFLVVVRDDLPEDVAYLLTWCLVETRANIEAKYKHIPPHKSPLSYPLDPKKMAKTSLLLHSGAEKFYKHGGYL